VHSAAHAKNTCPSFEVTDIGVYPGWGE